MTTPRKTTFATLRNRKSTKTRRHTARRGGYLVDLSSGQRNWRWARDAKKRPIIREGSKRYERRHPHRLGMLAGHRHLPDPSVSPEPGKPRPIVEQVVTMKPTQRNPNTVRRENRARNRRARASRKVNR